MKKYLQNKRPLLRGFVLGALTGAVVFLLLYGPSTLNVTYDSWIRCGYVEEDIIQHYATWQFFRNASWQFPLTWMDNAAAPLGAAAAWGDPLPWAALFFKMLSPLLPATFQYFGLVALLHFMLQGGFAWILIRLFDDRRVICLLGTLLFCFWPVFLERVYRHGSLSAQWLVLAMLYLYFLSRRQKTLPWFSWCVIFGLIPGIHAYFLPMAFGLLCACALENMLREKRFWRPIGLIVLCVGLALACARGLGVIMPNTSTGDNEPFGRYSMNLNALFNPSSADYYTESGKLDWSLLLPQLGQARLQYDGFNYLGLGILLGLVCILVWGLIYAFRHGIGASAKQIGKTLLAHIGLVIACLAFTIFSVSNVVYWGEQLLFQIRLPGIVEAIVTTFRSSGRIFWPVGYLLALCVILFCARCLPQNSKQGQLLAVAALCAVLAVQLIDMGGVLQYKHDHFAGGVLIPDNDFESERAAQLMAGTDTIRCMGNMFDYRLAECIIRGNPDMQTDIFFFARGGAAVTYARYAENYAAVISGEPIDENTLYIASDRSTCDEVLANAHENVVAWQLGKFYLFGVATADRPAPDLT